MMGGSIRVESNPGEASVFYFTLPVNSRPESQMESWPDIAENYDHSEAARLNVLIVEDDDVSELMLEKNLTKTAGKILKARTGYEAIEMVRNHPEIDLILMDIRLPEMDGYEATRQIRQYNKEVVIIAQTAYRLTSYREKSIEAGCNDYVAKPIKMEQLFTMIRKYFQ